MQEFYKEYAVMPKVGLSNGGLKHSICSNSPFVSALVFRKIITCPVRGFVIRSPGLIIDFYFYILELVEIVLIIRDGAGITAVVIIILPLIETVALRLYSAIEGKLNNVKYQMFNQEQIRAWAGFDFASGNLTCINSVFDKYVYF